MVFEQNKKNLAAFLFQENVLRTPTEKIIVTAEGFADQDGLICNDDKKDLSGLKASYEEADTRTVLNAIHCMFPSSHLYLYYHISY